MFISSSFCMAANGDIEKDTTKKSSSKKDSVVVSLNKNQSSEFEIAHESGVIEVSVSGNFDKYSSVSITNTRGTDLYFEFINNGSSRFSFDISNLEEGSYYVVLNSNDEVRMKRFKIN